MVKLLIPRETASGERRVAATPETVRRLVAKGATLQVERGAGQSAGFLDADYAAVGAELWDGDAGAWGTVDGVLCVQPPRTEDLGRLREEALVVGLLAPYGATALVDTLNSRRASGIALELLPRITRAQSMDVLSSQANIAGYKAVLLAAAALDRYVPMLMTAAGTIQPSRVLILGAGVAGLQALATARRLGGVVYVSDVRPAVKEQVESLGGRFIDPPQLEEAPAEVGGYARQASEAFLAAQRQQLADQLALADMVICTALVPGRPAPRLISEAMLDGMRPGAVVVDLAVAQGGNCFGTIPGATVERHGVLLIGADALPSTVPNHASALYARNIATLIEHVLGEDGFRLDPEDPILDGCLFTHAGVCRRDDIVEPAGLSPIGARS
ncbi:NAD(P) transhydrogenase subunit alpha [Synechococcus sp. BA-132 BA5]|uniref:NAD(P) transhydrogenase subunit alpha n=1 Tax=Synechococcus sp. BA-132 BA5 TaxID=3110252 RepID=UPI002B1F10CF|nr:NAD(P) transhydrogenase subunit alpha [Synechococcus sp. BA-132 BA5]MEA5415104.1 NAD(P) transhydrogenase subunit alpha [Synechococcus sp. BA-132 BA5]